jgi:23S rRNA (guanosine2251-2'-O)-methyltransferase
VSRDGWCIVWDEGPGGNLQPLVTTRPPFRRHTTTELVARRPSPEAREETRLPVVVVLDDVRSAYNVGLIFRLCDCVNVQALWLGGITPYPGVSTHASNHIHKTGVGGSIHVLPWRHLADPVPAVADLKAAGWRVVVVEQGEGSVPWHRADYRAPLVLVFGHERTGVRDALLALADEIVELPARGVTNNLNVALCASAVLYGVLAALDCADPSGACDLCPGSGTGDEVAADAVTPGGRTGDTVAASGRTADTVSASVGPQG